MKRYSIGASIGLALLAVAACGEAPPQEDLGVVSSDLTTITRSEALARGELWVAAKVPYCQAANHQPDGDKACAATCTRPNNPQWDPFRSDCSGFVSWSWGLSAPGRTTAELAPAVTDITHTIDPKTLLPGDAVNKPSDHTMLFVKWVTVGTRATFMEEPGCSSATPYAHQIDSNVTINGMSITVAENGLTFSAIRFDGIVDDPDAGAPDASAANDSGQVAPHEGQLDAGAATDEASTGSSTGDNVNDLNAAPKDSSSGGCATAPGRSNVSLGALAFALACFIAAKRRRDRALAS